MNARDFVHRLADRCIEANQLHGTAGLAVTDDGRCAAVQRIDLSWRVAPGLLVSDTIPPHAFLVPRRAATACEERDAERLFDELANAEARVPWDAKLYAYAERPRRWPDSVDVLVDPRARKKITLSK